MKALRGLTLIEVVAALAVTAILLPVLGIVFYDVLVTPPRQTARLTLNNEVALLSTWLYNDAHTAESFALGDYPVSPYYGNFTYIDYTTGNEYLISYYATCPNGSAPDCKNRIVRQVILTNGSLPSSTPSSTPGSSATPAPTPTSVPSTQTYTLCDGGGPEDQAWAKAWNNSEGLPSSPDYFWDDSDRALVDADESAWDLVCAIDEGAWGDIDTDPPADYGISSQLYQFKVYQERDDVTSLSVSWRGYGGAFTHNTNFRIWNYTTSSWLTIVDESDPDSRNNDTYTYPISSSPSSYINSSTGYVTMLASADAGGATPEDTDFGTALLFNGANNSVAASSTVPTDTFTFEAWVKCTEEITMYSEATSGTQGCSGQHYVFWPTHGGETDAGVGLSVGTNGISVYEHGSGYLPPLAAYECNLGTAWNHIAVVYSSDVAEIYLNGNSVGTGLTSTRGTAYAPYTIGYGADWGSGPSYFNGTIDEVRVWNIALTEGQIEDNMYREVPNPASEANLTGYWKFSNDVEDSSSNNNDGTLSTPAPEYVTGLSRDVTVYTDYLGLTVVSTGPTPTPGPTVGPTPSPIPTVVDYATSTTFTAPAGVTSVAVLVVGGGGGGGGVSSSRAYSGGGGGGAGGVVYNASYTVIPGNGYTVTIGNGGSGGAGGYNPGQNGQDSVFGGITAYGGGGGGAVSYNAVGLAGGSGGGGGGQTLTSTAFAGGDADYISPRQGYDGAKGYSRAGLIALDCIASGGGGGAGGKPDDAAYCNVGEGGIGVDYSGTFGNVGGNANGKFAGGGGGANIWNPGLAVDGYGGGNGAEDGGTGETGKPGVDGTGGGGGGAYSDGVNRAGGDGGNGRVVIKYATPYFTLSTSAGDGGAVTEPDPPGYYYLAGTNAPIIAEADPCYQFVNWTGTGVTAGKVANASSYSTTIYMDGDYTVQANFTPITAEYDLTLTPDPIGGGYPSYEGASPFACGVNVSISANPETGATFSGWTPEEGIADPGAADTTVQMTATRDLIAHFNGSTSTPTPPEPTPTNYLSTLYLTQHVTADNFSLSRSGGLIKADINASVVTSMGKYVYKSLTIYLKMRPSYLLPDENIWGDNTVSTVGGFRISGGYSSFSGNVQVNGTVTVVSSATRNVIDGTLTCPSIVGDDQTKLSYTQRITQSPNNVMPDLGDPQQYFNANLTAGVQVLDDVLREYVFTGNVTLTYPNPTGVWLNSTTLKPGNYYSPGTITLAGHSYRGSVTFMANQVIINNIGTSSWFNPERKIALSPYNELLDGLLVWANGSVGSPTTDNDGAILIQGSATWHPCVSLKGVLFAPNGEIELAGSGRTGMGFIAAAELYDGALVAQDLTLSGSYWNFYRW